MLRILRSFSYAYQIYDSLDWKKNFFKIFYHKGAIEKCVCVCAGGGRGGVVSLYTDFRGLFFFRKVINEWCIQVVPWSLSWIAAFHTTSLSLRILESDTHREKAVWSKTPVLTKSNNMSSLNNRDGHLGWYIKLNLYKRFLNCSKK